jgi:hypothetical protein
MGKLKNKKLSLDRHILDKNKYCCIHPNGSKVVESNIISRLVLVCCNFRAGSDKTSVQVIQKINFQLCGFNPHDVFLNVMNISLNKILFLKPMPEKCP